MLLNSNANTNKGCFQRIRKVQTCKWQNSQEIKEVQTVEVKKEKSFCIFIFYNSIIILPFLLFGLGSAVQEKVNRGGVLLPVCPGHPGKHLVRPQRPAEEPRRRPGREELHRAPPAVAGGQPGDPDARPHRILCATGPPSSPSVPPTCYMLSSCKQLPASGCSESDTRHQISKQEGNEEVGF